MLWSRFMTIQQFKKRGNKLMKIKKLLVMFSMLLMSMVMTQEAKSQIMEIGATAGLSYYIGDINPNRHYAQSEFAWGASVRYYQSPRWAFRFQYSNLNLSAADAKSSFRPERALAFSNKVNDFALLAEFNFFDYWTGSKRNFISPYIFAGVSLFTFNPVHPDGTQLHDVMTEGVDYNLTSWSIPFGIGVKYSLFKRIGLTLEWRLHKTFTDYIDDIHGLYPEIDVVNGDYIYSDPTGNYEAGMQRGNGTNESSLGYNCDWFGTLGLTVSFRFNLPKSKSCDAGSNSRYY